ncbi:TolC family outer membrane protein [Asticcacaulis benevestitus]|nr:TolC family outer membrane protein [Asticcacaulis benevestitus]
MVGVKLRYWMSGVAATISLAFAPQFANADTLLEAIVQAYQSNPVLQSQRYDLKALDESYVRAYSAIRPKGDLQVTADYVDSRAGDATQALRLAADPLVGRRLQSNKDDVRLVMEQMLYSGGQTSSAIDAASYRVQSGRQSLRIAEGDLLLQVIGAYEDVNRDTENLAARQANLKALERQLEMTEARRVAGEVTRTDVEQAKAQLEAARAQMTLTQVQLQSSRATYAALVGQNPGTLDEAPALPLVPTTLDQAFDIAMDNSPELLQARFNERESQKQADQARSANNMVVSARTSYGFNGQLSPYDRRDQDADFSVSLTFTKPLFSGGANASGYREAINRNAGDRLRIEGARRVMVQNIVGAWNQVVSAKLNLDIQQRQLAAAEIAAEGMQEEFRFGQRSTLDVLVAEQNLTEAKLALIASRRDAYVAQASLLRHIGYLEARVLIVGINPYDVAGNLRTIQSKNGVPWEHLIRGVDTLGQSHAHQTRLDELDQTKLYHAIAPASGELQSLELGTESPTTPIPGTAGHSN